MIYVDELMSHGWILRGRTIRSCHMFSDTLEFEALHALAARIGLRRSWFQGKASTPHYDLTTAKRAEAIAAGAVSVDRRRAVEIWRARRSLAQARTHDEAAP